MEFPLEIAALDTRVLLYLNQLFPASMDTFWMAITKTITWLPLYAVLVGRIISSSKDHSTWIFRLALITAGVLIWDQGSGFFKDWVARPRPCHEVDGLRVLVHCSSYGFFSAHAANSFGIAFLTRKWLHSSWFPILLLVATLQSFSRIHLGVHYPVDIIAGAIFGYLGARLLLRIDKNFSQ